MVVLGVDPGKQNTACALVRLVGGYPPVYLASGPIPMFEDDLLLADRLPCWRTDFLALLRVVPDLVVLERYVPRPGMSRGAPAEVINLYIGLVVDLCLVRQVPYILVMPSVHKQHYARTWGTHLIENLASPHEADSVSLAIYGCHYLLARSPRWISA